MARNDHQRALLSIATTHFNTFLHILSLSLYCPALWTIVIEAIYDLRESNNFVRTYAPHFTLVKKPIFDVKFVSKVREQLCDSRKSYIASVTIIQRAGNAMPQI